MFVMFAITFWMLEADPVVNKHSYIQFDLCIAIFRVLILRKFESSEQLHSW